MEQSISTATHSQDASFPTDLPCIEDHVDGQPSQSQLEVWYEDFNDALEHLGPDILPPNATKEVSALHDQYLPTQPPDSQPIIHRLRELAEAVCELRAEGHMSASASSEAEVSQVPDTSGRSRFHRLLHGLGYRH